MSTTNVGDPENYATAAIRVSASATDVSQIAALIPLMPTRKTERAKSAAAESRWVYESDLSSSSIEDQIENLLSLIEANRSSFKTLPADCEIDIWCTISSQREFVGFYLSRALLKRAASLDVEFVFSVYRGNESDAH
jgi:hypothetical protein